MNFADFQFLKSGTMNEQVHYETSICPTEFDVYKSIDDVEGQIGLIPPDAELIKMFITNKSNSTPVAFAILSSKETGVEEPYNGTPIPGCPWYLHWLQISPLCRGKGYGRLFVEKIRKSHSGNILLESIPTTVTFWSKMSCVLASNSEQLLEEMNVFMVLPDDDQDLTAIIKIFGGDL